MTITTRDISYEVDGIEMVGHLAYDDATDNARPSVLLSHEGSGLAANVKQNAVTLADLGYCAFALDYYGGGVMPPMEEAMALLGPMMDDLSITRRRAVAGLDVLLAQPQCDASRVAAIGYCWGGAMSLEIARSGADVKAVVGFHPSMTISPDSSNIAGSVLLCVGTDDPFVSRDDRLAFEDHMHASKVKDWQIDVYGGVGHSFTNPDVDAAGIPGLKYDAAAHARSWQSMLRLFGETIG
jgi:dienelactone hydrolase